MAWATVPTMPVTVVAEEEETTVPSRVAQESGSAMAELRTRTVAFWFLRKPVASLPAEVVLPMSRMARWEESVPRPWTTYPAVNSPPPAQTPVPL